MGRKLQRWLDTGVDTKPEVIAVASDDSLAGTKAEVINKLRDLGARDIPELVAIVAKHAGGPNPNAIKDIETMSALLADIEEYEKSNKE